MIEPLENDDEPDLVRAAQRGDVAAFSTLVERHHAAVRACLAVRMIDVHEAEDLAQEAFIIAFRKLPDSDPDLPLGPWLRGIALKLLANHRRKFRAQASGSAADLRELLDAEVSTDFGAGRESETMTALRECLDELEGPSRQLLHERYADGASIDELAGRLGRKASAVTMQLHRLRGLLATCIERNIEPSAP